ncbi:hypothetical protein Ga0123461_1584 [Mariprofundus aestuarium]|uniref:Uncharacterized protein n=1 Tax=Mariprofundus aestuarium TaxID=1921086 RepID=A0A2K8KYF0_MARES|nr:hypothetical protein [Mariprofundus aestuarium]ATX79997.1 hypothetical protein Ga0123461_1584 [Mariprofundus aestuarium]
MADLNNVSPHEQFKQEDSEVRQKIAKAHRNQTITWTLSVLLAAILFGGLAFAHLKHLATLTGMADDLSLILMTVTILVTTGYVVFIFFYFGTVRRIYHAHSVIHQRLKDQVHPDEHPKFSWHSYFRKEGTESRNSGFGVIFAITTKVAILFAAILILQFGWMHMMAVSGHELQTEHYAYLGLIDLTLFSSLVLFIVVLLAVRIGALGKRGEEHKFAKEHHPPEDPNRAR